MPKSQFASSTKLRALVIYFAVAFVVVLGADFAIQAMGPTRIGRQVLVLAWLVLFPYGGWMVWRRG